MGAARCPVSDDSCPSVAEAEIARLTAERDGLREAGQITLDEFHLLDEKGKTELSGNAVRRFGALLAHWFEEQGGTSYVEVELCRRIEDGGEHFLFTVQRVGFRTPHQLRAAAEADRDQARADLAEAVEVLRAFVSACNAPLQAHGVAAIRLGIALGDAERIVAKHAAAEAEEE